MKQLCNYYNVRIQINVKVNIQIYKYLIKINEYKNGIESYDNGSEWTNTLKYQNNECRNKMQHLQEDCIIRILFSAYTCIWDG